MMKKKLAAVAAFVGAGVPAVFAQESGGSMTVDISDAESAVNAVGKALSDLISGTVTTNILTIIGAGLVITALFLGIRWILKGGKQAAKG